MIAGTRFSATTTADTGPRYALVDTDILITPTGSSGNFVASGEARIQIWYYLITDPTV
jgi:hypothetical protein